MKIKRFVGIHFKLKNINIESNLELIPKKYRQFSSVSEFLYTIRCILRRIKEE